MKNFKKLALIFVAVFVSYFTLVAFLSMDATHGFFYLNPTKICIRIFVPILLTAQIWSMISKK